VNPGSRSGVVHKLLYAFFTITFATVVATCY